MTTIIKANFDRSLPTPDSKVGEYCTLCGEHIDSIFTLVKCPKDIFICDLCIDILNETINSF